MRVVFKTMLVLAIIAFISYVTIRDFGLPRVPREIHLTYPAVQYTADDPAAVIHTTLEIEGTYYRYLFHHPTFKGVVRVHEHDFTMLESEIMEYPLYAYDRIYKASPDVRDSILTSFLSYPIWEHNSRGDFSNFQFKYLGELFIDNRFEQVKIHVNREFGDGTDRATYLAAPATTLEEAQQILKFTEIFE
ncbi:hypothetical protein JCM10914A_18260 [Paenibacillus sp. JCM 10914]|uniref:hypothetical protein n=1 Tax=Paenibacillus sp. JCM 10914 TaxID=1236974 RepID=UPI0003CC5087|nr:hypothetical protein [Paenibacillus sp. JCM 10914]GAE06305.1 hypothetical protein JCM10914_2455 [Paenibacillus sp. JCM 10914]